MANTDKKKSYPRMTSPQGVFRYPALAAPDYGNDKYPAPQGVFKVSLVLKESDPTTQNFIERLMPFYRDAEVEGLEAFAALPVGTRKKLKEVSKGSLYETVYDKDTEQPTGEIEFRFKLNASGIYKRGPNAGKKWSAQPVLFDAMGRKMDPAPNIWGGTVGRIGFQPMPYFVASDGKYGLSLRLTGAQIINLVTKGDYSAEQLGFGAVEGGYAFEPAANDNTPMGEAIGDEVAF